MVFWYLRGGLQYLSGENYEKAVGVPVREIRVTEGKVKVNEIWV